MYLLTYLLKKYIKFKEEFFLGISIINYWKKKHKMKNLILGIVLIFTLIGCASKKDYKDFTIEDMKNDCYGKDEFKSCYRLGNQYLKENNKKEALYYFSQGCFSFYNSGIRKDKKSCLIEAEIIKNDEKFYDSELNKSNMGRVGDYYYNDGDFTKAYEYYQEYFKYKSILLGQTEYDNEVYYKMSQIILKGTDNVSKDIKLSEIYYIKSLQFEIIILLDKAIRKHQILKKIFPTIEVDTEISADGKILNTIITTIPKDENISSKVYKLLQEHNFNPIPKEYNLQQIKVNKVTLKTNANQK